MEWISAFGHGLMELHEWVNGFIGGWPMLILLVGTGVYLSVKTSFFQLSHFFTMLRKTLGSLGKSGRTSSQASISPLQAVSTALAGTIGTGNLAGVATAIVTGGPGSLFWMWLSAFFGMATKYAEVVLAIRFRKKGADGVYLGGPMYYIDQGLGRPGLAAAFAFCCALASFGIGNMAQVNAVSSSMDATFGIPTWVTGVFVSGIVGLVLLGGIRRIGRVAERIVPLMAVFYMVGGTLVLIHNRHHIPQAFHMIFTNALNLQAGVGGIMGYTVMQAVRQGFARGIFSNEAGLGSASIAHAAAETDHPVHQGFWGMFEVFFDTIIICTFTGLIVLTAADQTLWQSGLSGAPLTNAAFSAALGPWGGIFVSISIVFFAITAILGWAFYGERAIGYLLHDNQIIIIIYRVLFIACLVLGAIVKMELAWQVADTLNGLMAIPNLIALIGMSGIVREVTRQYRKSASK